MSARDRLGSPWVLASLVGLYPALFYASNNWFMFEPIQGLRAFGSVWLFAFVLLCSLHLTLRGVGSAVWRLSSARWGADPEKSTALRARTERTVFAVGCIVVLVYLLRQTPTELLPVAVGLLVLWPSARWAKLDGLSRFTAVLLVLCLFTLAGGLVSVLKTTASTPTAGSSLTGSASPDASGTRFDDIRLRKRPNVYFIVPDAYPSRSALDEIFGIDDQGLQESLASLGFTIYDGFFSNYMYTLGSIAASLGMRHHYYQGNVGNAELLGGAPLHHQRPEPGRANLSTQRLPRALRAPIRIPLHNGL